jgi:hypothetical protein
MKRRRFGNPNPRPQRRTRHSCPQNGKIEAHREIVTQAGADYVCSNAMGCDLVMFNSRESGSTLCVHETLLSVKSVRAHLTESNEKFGLATPPLAS